MGLHPTIVLDPPWNYKEIGYQGFDSVPGFDVNCPYPVMTQKELLALGDSVRQVAGTSSHLYCWTTATFMGFTYKMLEAWGIPWTRIRAIPWLKVRRLNSGYWRASTVEFLLFGTWPGCWIGPSAKMIPCHAFDGSPAWKLEEAIGHEILTPDQLPNDLGFIAEIPGKHSAKPEASYAYIERGSPGPYIEFFARNQRDGWLAVGNEIDGADIHATLARMIEERRK